MTANHDLHRDMREFSYWKSRRDELINAALDAGVPVEVIVAEMNVASSVVYRIKKRDRG